jgi:hypothetical protein
MLRMIAVVTLLLLALVGNMLRVDHVALPHSEPTAVERFMQEVAKIESGGNYRVVNQYGMLGKYQFSPSTIRMLGFTHSKQEFLKNPHLQDTVMVKYIYVNQQELEHLIERYEGKTVKGVKITRATILAGAHFAGSGGVRRFLTNPDDVGIIDGNGMKLPVYMSKFKNVHLPPITL